MTPIELQKTLSTMTIIVDSREHETPEAVKRWAAFGVPWERAKLDSGDYSAAFVLPDNQKWRVPCCVERKMSLSEICSNFCQNRQRFVNEFERLKQSGERVYLLIENANWEKAYAGRYRSKMRPQALVASLTAWMARYDAHIVFCQPETTPKLIHDILYREAKERLQSEL